MTTYNVYPEEEPGDELAFQTTPLHIAVMEGNLAMIEVQGLTLPNTFIQYLVIPQVLVAAGADVAASGTSGYPPCLEAIEAGHSDALFTLVQAGGDRASH